MTARSVHVPVMVREVLAALQLSPGLTVVDGTVGAGGHAARILQQITETGRLFGFDRDPMMLNFARQRLDADNVELIRSSYAAAADELSRRGVTAVDRVLLDLGLSSDQLIDRNRGFGFDAGGQLDMRFDDTSGRGVAEYLADVDVDTLADALHRYGEVRNARGIAAALIAAQRSGDGLQTVDDLLGCLTRHFGRTPDRSQCAPVFQALRIAVNDELSHVESMMADGLPRILRAGGIAVVLTFHSLEDRIVKQTFRPERGWQPARRTPETAMPAEVRLNPRARSAKLRAAVRLSPPAD